MSLFGTKGSTSHARNAVACGGVHPTLRGQPMSDRFDPGDHVDG
jgi:hypothetical protein